MTLSLNNPAEFHDPHMQGQVDRVRPLEKQKSRVFVRLTEERPARSATYNLTGLLFFDQNVLFSGCILNKLPLVNKNKAFSNGTSICGITHPDVSMNFHVFIKDVEIMFLSLK